MMAAMFGGPAPYREAVSQRLADRDFDVVPPEDIPAGERHVAVVYCDTAAQWSELERRAADPDCVAVAIIPSLTLDLFIQALVMGSGGVVYIDTSSVIIADAIAAAVNGEILLPRQAAQNMAALARRERPPSNLDENESELLRAVSAGRTIVDLAAEMHYSERTVRRHLQSLYLKLGVRNRAEAIACAARLGLTD